MRRIPRQNLYVLQEQIPALQLERRAILATQEPYRVAHQVNEDRDRLEVLVGWLIVAALLTFVVVLVAS